MDKLYLFDVNDLTDISFLDCLKLLTESNQKKVLSYKQKEDQYLSLAARLLERKFIKKEIYYSGSGKPMADGCYFNISHCYPYVILSISTTTNLGVDIQKNKDFDNSFISRCFCKDELKEKTPIELWCIKEAYLKYLGTGIEKSLSSYKLEFINKENIQVNNDTLFYKIFWIENYAVCLVSKNKLSINKVNKLTLEKIL